MRQTTRTGRKSSEKIVKDIRRATHKQYSSEDKIRIVLDGLRGEDSIAELCRREGISQGIYYKIKVDKPSRDDFTKIFVKTCRHYKSRPDEEVLKYLLNTKYPSIDNEFAAYQAPFLIDQSLSICEYEGYEPHMSIELIDRAWENLYVED
jgi:transposase-like protein